MSSHRARAARRSLVLAASFALALALPLTLLLRLPRAGADPAAQVLAQGLPLPERGSWRFHGCATCIRQGWITQDAVWAATLSGGVVRWDRATGSLRQYLPDAGLGGRSITRMSLAEDGLPWVAHNARSSLMPRTGISRFDGQRWQAYDLADGLPGLRVDDLDAGEGGRAAALTDGGLARFDRGAWQAIPPPTEALSVTDVALAADGELFVGAANGVWRGDGGAWTALPALDRPRGAILDLELGPDGALWALTESEIGRWPDARGDASRWSRDPLALGALDEGLGDGLRVSIRANALWLVAGTEAYLHEPDGWRRTLDASGVHDQVWRSGIAWHPDGESWVFAMNESPMRGRDGVWERVPWEVGPSNHIVFSVDVAPDGSPWFGLMSFLNPDNLVNHYREAEGRWTRFRPADGLRRGSTLGITQRNVSVDERSGVVWVADVEGWVGRYHGGRWTTLAVTDALGVGTRVWGLAADGREGVWLATTHGALHYDGQGWERLDAPAGLDEAVVRDVDLDERNDPPSLWLATSRGLWHRQAGAWTVHGRAEGLTTENLGAVVVDEAHGAVWTAATVGAGAHVARVDASGVQGFDEPEGLRATGFWNLDVDADGRPWLAISDEQDFRYGLAYHDGARWHSYGVEDGLPDKDVFDVAIGPDGRVWLAMLTGVGEWRPPGWEAATPATPTPTPSPRATPATPAPTPTPPPSPMTATPVPDPACVCDSVAGRVPDAVVAAALARPETIGGWGQRLDPAKPPGPFNPPRTCLNVHDPSKPYHELFNGLVWRVGCR